MEQGILDPLNTEPSQYTRHLRAYPSLRDNLCKQWIENGRPHDYIADHRVSGAIAPAGEWQSQLALLRLWANDMIEGSGPGREMRFKALHYRAWHRGTREADYMIGGFFDAYHAQWNESELGWFETVIDEQDVDIMSWALGRSDPPSHLDGPMLERLRRLDYIAIPR